MLRRRLMQSDSSRFMIGNYEVVDLNLPSGKLWATCNIGATKETDYGDYCMYGFGSSRYYGNENPLASSADNATQIMGEGWRTPTQLEYSELLLHTNNEWVTNFNGSGINGCKFTNKTNPNAYIFLPAAGYYRNDELVENGSSVAYWTSTPYSPTLQHRNYAYSTDFGSSFMRLTNMDRSYGCPIRGITKFVS